MERHCGCSGGAYGDGSRPPATARRLCAVSRRAPRLSRSQRWGPAGSRDAMPLRLACRPRPRGGSPRRKALGAAASPGSSHGHCSMASAAATSATARGPMTPRGPRPALSRGSQLEQGLAQPRSVWSRRKPRFCPYWVANCSIIPIGYNSPKERGFPTNCGNDRWAMGRR